MARKKGRYARPKLRTESHVIAELSVNFLERRVLKRRHQYVCGCQHRSMVSTVALPLVAQFNAFRDDFLQHAVRAQDTPSLRT